MKNKFYQEEENSTYSSNGKEYKLNVLFELTKSKDPVEMEVSLFDWILPYTKVEKSRVEKADLDTPILVFYDIKDKRWIVIDGAHRLTKAVQQKRKTILCIVVSQKMLDEALIENKKIFIDNKFFHISFRDDLEGIWQPQIPAGSDIGKKTKLSEPDIPRISIAPSIEDCFRAIYPNVSKYFETEKYPWMEFFVYSPLDMEKKKILDWKDLVKKKYVHDAHVTKESWILEPVKMILMMKIKIMNTEQKNNELLYHPFNDREQELRYHSPKEIDVKILRKYQNISTENRNEGSIKNKPLFSKW